MRVSTMIPAALAAAPAVQAIGQLGFCVGTKMGTEASPTCKTTQDYVQDFQAIKGESTWVRGYDASDCDFAKNALAAAKQTGVKVILGIWPDTPESYKAGKAAVTTYVPQYMDQVYGITVGSETLYRGNFTGQELMDNYISDIKKALPKVKVGTADSWNKYADGTADPVIRGADFLLVNAFAYWQGQNIKNASHTFFDDIGQATARIQKTRGATDNIPVIVGETGWTTQGTTYQAAVPSVQNAQTFWKQGVCGMREWGVDVFSFEAFDESWKPNSISDNGTPADEKHWGVYDASRKAKFDLSC